MTDDALFGRIESWQGDRPWGSVLDAGTGQASADDALDRRHRRPGTGAFAAE
jgi:hypothetical protein